MNAIIFRFRTLPTFGLTLSLAGSAALAQFAPGPNPINGNTTAAQTLSAGVGEVTTNGSLSVSGSAVAITMSGTSILTNNGIVFQRSAQLDDFNFINLGVAPGSYTLFSTVNLIDGSLGTNSTGTISGMSAALSLGDANTDLVLTVVPEPTIAALAGISFLGWLLFGTRRRKGWDRAS